MIFNEFLENSLLVYSVSKYAPKYYINGALEIYIDEDGQLTPKDMDKLKRNLGSEVVDSDIDIDSKYECVNIHVTLDRWE